MLLFIIIFYVTPALIPILYILHLLIIKHEEVSIIDTIIGIGLSLAPITNIFLMVSAIETICEKASFCNWLDYTFNSKD